MEFSDILMQVVGALITSLVITSIGAYVSLKIQGESLRKTTEAVKDLTIVVAELKNSLGVFGERYVTRDELERKLDKLEERLKNGS